jgi:nocardicin N-oxygenase
MRKVYRYGFDPSHRLDPAPLYGPLRSEEPVARVTLPHGEDGWLVTRHESVKTVLKNPRFSRAAVVAAGERIPRATEFVPLTDSMSALDPPEHTRLRKLITRVFTRFAVEQHRPRAQQIAGELIDEMIAGGPPLDFVSAFAVPFQTLIVEGILGVPQSDHLQFRECTRPVSTRGNYTKQQRDAAFAGMCEYVSSLVARKREQPGDDLLSTLVLSHVDQQQITEREVVDFAVTLLVNNTVANQICNCCYLLLTYPDQLGWLRANMSQVPEAVEELLRFAPLALDIPGAGQGQVRMAMADMEIDGVCIRAGEFVLPSIISANRDERVFIDAHKLDLTRTANSHIAFGIGPHHCPGDKLARMEMQVAVGSLLTRFPNFALAVSVDEVSWKQGMASRGPTALPVTW